MVKINQFKKHLITKAENFFWLPTVKASRSGSARGRRLAQILLGKRRERESLRVAWGKPACSLVPSSLKVQLWPVPNLIPELFQFAQSLLRGLGDAIIVRDLKSMIRSDSLLAKPFVSMLVTHHLGPPSSKLTFVLKGPTLLQLMSSFQFFSVRLKETS